MLEPSQKKRIILLVTLLLAIGIGLAVWLLLMNQVEVTFQAKAPYEMEISDGKKMACLQDQCQIVLAPGNYSVTITKAGYRDFVEDFSATLGDHSPKQADLQFIPTLKEISATEFENGDIQPKLTDEQLKQLDIDKVFYDQEAILYLAMNKETNLQTLYSQTFKKGSLGAQIAITSFQRPIKKYLISPDLKNQKIALIDISSQNSTLYFIDVKNKTRTNLLNFPSIANVMWIPNSKDFLFQARANNTLQDSIFRYSFTSQKAIALPIAAAISNIMALDQNRLIVATNQLTDDAQTLNKEEGKLVDMVSDALPTSNQQPSLSFIDFSLVSQQGRLIKNFPNMPLPESIRLLSDQKGVFFKSGEKYYQLRISE